MAPWISGSLGSPPGVAGQGECSQCLGAGLVETPPRRNSGRARWSRDPPEVRGRQFDRVRSRLKRVGDPLRYARVRSVAGDCCRRSDLRRRREMRTRSESLRGSHGRRLRRRSLQRKCGFRCRESGEFALSLSVARCACG